MTGWVSNIWKFVNADEIGFGPQRFVSGVILAKGFKVVLVSLDVWFVLLCCLRHASRCGRRLETVDLVE